ncbi:MAG: hypothetical protein LC132_00605, partial [Burkholderiales bacterium]|nr:hypothetical protein [Burkholderiales bacterium]
MSRREGTCLYPRVAATRSNMLARLSFAEIDTSSSPTVSFPMAEAYSIVTADLTSPPACSAISFIAWIE